MLHYARPLKPRRRFEDACRPTCRLDADPPRRLHRRALARAAGREPVAQLRPSRFLRRNPLSHFGNCRSIPNSQFPILKMGAIPRTPPPNHRLGGIVGRGMVVARTDVSAPGREPARRSATRPPRCSPPNQGAAHRLPAKRLVQQPTPRRYSQHHTPPPLRLSRMAQLRHRPIVHAPDVTQPQRSLRLLLLSIPVAGNVLYFFVG